MSWATHGHSGLTSPLWRPLSAGVPTLLAPSVPPVLAPSTLSPGLGSPTCLSKVSSSRSLLTCPLHCRAVLLSSAGWHCRLCAVPTSFYPNSGYGWRRQWQPTPVLLPGNSHGRRSLVGCSPSCHEESDATERLHFHFHTLEKEMATHSSVLAWRIPGTGDPGGLPSVGWHRVGHD